MVFPGFLEKKGSREIDLPPYVKCDHRLSLLQFRINNRDIVAAVLRWYSLFQNSLTSNGACAISHSFFAAMSIRLNVIRVRIREIFKSHNLDISIPNLSAQKFISAFN